MLLTVWRSAPISTHTCNSHPLLTWYPHFTRWITGLEQIRVFHATDQQLKSAMGDLWWDAAQCSGWGWWVQEYLAFVKQLWELIVQMKQPTSQTSTGPSNATPRWICVLMLSHYMIWACSGGSTVTNFRTKNSYNSWVFFAHLTEGKVRKCNYVLLLSFLLLLALLLLLLPVARVPDHNIWSKNFNICGKDNHCPLQMNMIFYLNILVFE